MKDFSLKSMTTSFPISTDRISSGLLTACVAATLAVWMLTGCGMGTVDTSVSPVQAAPDSVLQGSVYGGHAPIVGAEVFLLTPGVTGYYSKATDIMTNAALPVDATFGYHYVTTTTGGYFSITGDYACTPNYPVVLAAYGGNPITVPPVILTGESISGAGPYTIKFSNIGPGLLYQGEVVTITGLTGSWAYLNGNQTVLGDANLTTTTFDISVASNGGNATGGYAVGGSLTQATTSTNSNPAIVNLAVLGLCPASGATNFGSASSAPINFIYTNEVSTVAAGYALAGFQSGQWYDIGIPAPATDALALKGIQNATQTASNLFDITGGNLGTPGDGADYHIARATTAGTNGTVPQYLLNTLANILANCVDSNNTSSGASTQCTSLFGYAKSAGTSGTTPTDTATAIFNIAHNPWANVASLFNLPTGNVPFLPQLAAAPNDFSVGIVYTGGGMSGGFFSAIDASGNIWVGNSSGNSVSEFSNLGVALSGATGFAAGTTPYGIAIDTSGNVWVSDYGSAKLTKLTSTGAAAAGSPFTGNGLNEPYSIAIDTLGNLWIPQYGSDTLSKFTSAGGAGGNFSGSGMNRPRGITLSSALTNTIYIANENSTVLSEFNLTTGAALNTGITSASTNYNTEVVLDAAGDMWVASDLGNSLVEYAPNGTAISPAAGYTGGGVSNPYFLAIDGANTVFSSNGGGNSISAFKNSGTAISNANGYVATTSAGGKPLAEPLGISIDGSGNAWVVSIGNNELVEYVGIAAPVVTPRVTALIQGKFGAKP